MILFFNLKSFTFARHVQGGCPLADDCTAALEGCDSYKVDMLHWELMATDMGVSYGPNNSTGKDEVANKDDTYSVSRTCRFDDDGSVAGNEWEGSWSHYMPVETGVVVERASTGGEDGGSSSSMSKNITMAEVRKHNVEEDVWIIVNNKVYDCTEYLPTHPGGPDYILIKGGEESTESFVNAHRAAVSLLDPLYLGDLDLESLAEYAFEMSRPLRTISTETDVQFEAGTNFGFAFWVSPS